MFLYFHAIGFKEVLVMLRNRSRSVSSKQAIVPDHNTTSKTSQNQNQNQTNPISPIFFTGSPRFLNGFLARSLSDAMTPKSILDNQNFCNFVNSNFLEMPKKPNVPEAKKAATTTHYKFDSEAIGLAIIDEIKECNNNICEPNRKMVSFGAKLMVQLPSFEGNSALTLKNSNSPPKSPAEFGIKNCSTPLWTRVGSFRQQKTTDEKLSLAEMELSEDYTCVITRGPNPRTTHIFDNCIVDSSLPNSAETHSSFLSFCNTCKNKLQEDEDIYMYRLDYTYITYQLYVINFFKSLSALQLVVHYTTLILEYLIV